MVKSSIAIGALALSLLAPAAASAQDTDLVAAGETVFRRCAACHRIGPDARNALGPELNGLIGRTAGTEPAFGYSAAMLEAGQGGLVWDEATLDAYLTDPKALVPGTNMQFAGLRKPEDRAAVIAYLSAAGS